MGNLVTAEEQQVNQTKSEENTKTNSKTNNNGSKEEELLNNILTKSQQLIKDYNGRTSGDPCGKLCVSLDKSLNRLSLKD